MPRTMPGRAAVTRISRSAVAASGLIPSGSGSSSARQTCRISSALRKRSRGVMVPPGAGRSAKGLTVTNLRPGCFAHLNMPCRICLVWFAFALLPRRIAMSASMMAASSSVIEATGRSFQPYTRPIRCSDVRVAWPVRSVERCAS